MVTTVMDTNEKVRAFLARFVHDATIDDDQDLFETGLVNSLFAVQLVLFVEKSFGIKVANEDLDVENFKSVAAIVGFIGAKISVA